MKLPKTILIIEDDAAMRTIIKSALSETAERFYEASNGREGLGFLGKNKIHAIILDYKMPEMDGVSFLKQMRAKRIDVPCIMVTAWASQVPSLRTEAVLWGVLQFLEKPFELDHLRAVSEKAIELSERISNVDIELETLCQKNNIPLTDRNAYVKQHRSQLILQLTMEAMSFKPDRKTGT